MKVIFHIGMGKTGTSSIQAALRNSSDELLRQKTQYLGLWFDIISEKFHGLSGTSRFLHSDLADMEQNANVFYNEILERKKNEGLDCFIISNEAIFENPSAFIHFVRRLSSKSDIDIRIIAYVRPPRDWLKSAYAQWGVSHKTVKGEIPSFKDFSPNLLRQYEAIKEWSSFSHKQLDIRLFSRNTDIVSDFSNAISLDIALTQRRMLERKEAVELIMRRCFNDTFPGEVLPRIFEEATKNSTSGKVETIEEILEYMFSTEGVDEAINEWSETWKVFSEKYKIDLLDYSGESSVPNLEDTRNRLIEYLLNMTVSQSKRIYRLELMLEERNRNVGSDKEHP